MQMRPRAVVQSESFNLQNIKNYTTCSVDLDFSLATLAQSLRLALT